MESCWACATQIQLPLDSSGIVVHTFKCGHCGALTSDINDERARCQQPNSRLSQTARITLVLVFICTIVIVGVSIVLPHDTPLWPAHYCATLCLSIQVLFNYAAAALKHPGEVNTSLADTAVHKAAGSLEGWTRCLPCAAAKPPSAHHCRSCNMCIEGLDHHCVFIGSCVGSSNKRSFVSFLFWVVISCVYVEALTINLLWQRRAEVAAMWTWSAQWLFLPRALLAWWRGVETLPAWLLGAQYLFCTSCGAVIGCSYLLMQQALSILTGITYVESLQLQKMQTVYGPKTLHRPTMKRLRLVFGDGHALLWLLPRWHDTSSSRKCM